MMIKYFKLRRLSVRYKDTPSLQIYKNKKNL